MKTTLAALAAAFLTACASVEKGPGPQDSIVYSLADLGLPKGARPESPYAISAGKDGLKVRVTSNGCTTMEHVRVIMMPPLPDHPPYGKLAVFRIKPDTCQSLVMASAWVEFSYAELGIKPTDQISIGTSLRAWTGPGE